MINKNMAEFYYLYYYIKQNANISGFQYKLHYFKCFEFIK